MAQAEAGPFKMILTLGMAGMLSGATLVGVYLVTAPIIEQNRAEALERAIYKVLPGAAANLACVVRDSEFKCLGAGEKPEKKEPAVYAGFDEAGAFTGFAIPAEGAGFQDVIKLMYGYAPDKKRVIGMEVLESRETPGLGDKIIKDRVWVAQFDDLAVEPDILATKKGASAPHEIDAISGATISSVAVCNIINAGNKTWLAKLPVTVAAPAAPAAAAPAGEAPAGAAGGQ